MILNLNAYYARFSLFYCYFNQYYRLNTNYSYLLLSLKPLRYLSASYASTTFEIPGIPSGISWMSHNHLSRERNATKNRKKSSNKGCFKDFLF